MQDIQVHSLGQEDLLEKEMANQSSILAWKILWTEEPGGLQSTWLQSVRHNYATEQRLNWHDVLPDVIPKKDTSLMLYSSQICVT